LYLTDDDIAKKIETFATDSNMLVDSIFGTGLSGQLKEPYRRLIESMNACSCPILAVDIPSGLDCDTGEPLGAAINASYTVTFVAVKKGFTSKSSAARYTGEIFVASIGIAVP
jgi:NAD(P)H-hydrate epimerase